MIDENTKKKLLFEVEKYGNIYAACLKVNVDKSTVYRWKKKSKKFKKELEDSVEIGRSNISDMSENGLLQNIKNGDQRAIEYALTHNSDRYRKKETSNVVIVHKKDFTPDVREPTLNEILAVHDKIFIEGQEKLDALEEQREAERLEREEQKRIREENWYKEHENIERIPPDYELEQQGGFIQKQEEKIEAPPGEETIQLKKNKNEVKIRRGPRPRNKEDRY